MHPTISASDLQVLRHEADAAARRLLRRLRLSRCDLADLGQESLLDVLARLLAFDAGRGSLGVFAGTVMTHKAARIACKVSHERALYGTRPVSLDAPLADGDGATLGDMVTEQDGLATFFGQPTDAHSQAERRLDLEHGLRHLDPGDAALCAALSHTSVDRLAASGKGARSSLYRRVSDIRLALMAAGLTAA